MQPLIKSVKHISGNGFNAIKQFETVPGGVLITAVTDQSIDQIFIPMMENTATWFVKESGIEIKK